MSSSTKDNSGTQLKVATVKIETSPSGNLGVKHKPPFRPYEDSNSEDSSFYSKNKKAKTETAKTDSNSNKNSFKITWVFLINYNSFDFLQFSWFFRSIKSQHFAHNDKVQIHNCKAPCHVCSLNNCYFFHIFGTWYTYCFFRSACIRVVWFVMQRLGQERPGQKPEWEWKRLFTDTAADAGSKMREMSQPRRYFRTQGPQTILPIQGLHVRQMYADRGKTARDGSPSGSQKTAGTGREKRNSFNDKRRPADEFLRCDANAELATLRCNKSTTEYCLRQCSQWLASQQNQHKWSINIQNEPPQLQCRHAKLRLL